MMLDSRINYVADTAIRSFFAGNVIDQCKSIYEEKTNAVLPNDDIPLVGNVYYPELNAIAGSMLGGIFLSRAIHWWRAKGRAAYHKANTAAGDETGRSWFEQEGFQSRREFESARRAVSSRVKKTEVADMLILTPEMLDEKGIEQRCVLYWRNGSGRMWYRVNEALVTALLLKQAFPERDNTDILRQVGVIDKEVKVSAPAKLAKEKPVKTETPAPVAAPVALAVAAKPAPPPSITDEQEPEPKPAKKNPLKLAIAYGYGFKDESGNPNENAPLVGNLLTQFVGNTKKGSRSEYTLKDYDFKDKPEMIVALAMWHEDIAKRGNYTKTTLPMGAESLHKNALSFLSLPAFEQSKWIAKAQIELDMLTGKTKKPLSLSELKKTDRYAYEVEMNRMLNMPPPEIHNKRFIKKDENQ